LVERRKQHSKLVVMTRPKGMGMYLGGMDVEKEGVQEAYDPILWLLGEDERVTEVGAMNFFVVMQREDGDVDLITPP